MRRPRIKTSCCSYVRANKVSTNAGESRRPSDHNFKQVSLTCWHTAVLMPMPTSHVSRTVSHCSLRVHRHAGRPGCWIAVVKHEGHIKQVRPEVTACAPQGAIPQPHNTQDRLDALR